MLDDYYIVIHINIIFYIIPHHHLFFYIINYLFIDFFIYFVLLLYMYFNFLFIFIIIYAVLKERQELGCTRISIEKQCNENNSVFAKDTKYKNNDTIQIIFNKLYNILDYHEKSGVWKRCVILSIIICFLIYTIDLQHKINIDEFKIMFIIICAILYFYHNFINYHHFRILQKNGKELLMNLNNKCSNNL